MSNISKTTQVETARQFVFLQRLSMAHDRCMRAIANLDETLLCTETVTGDWTIKDILGHVVTWNTEFRRAIRTILKKENPQPSPSIQEEIDFDEWNELRIAEKRKWTWRHIRADMERDYSEAIELIIHLQPNEFRKRGITPWLYSPPKEMVKFLSGKIESVETLVTYHWRHKNQHSSMMEKWRERNGYTW